MNIRVTRSELDDILDGLKLKKDRMARAGDLFYKWTNDAQFYLSAKSKVERLDKLYQRLMEKIPDND